MKKIITLIFLLATAQLFNKVLSAPKLNSFPSASATIFLDFDGHYVDCAFWNNGTPINCMPSTMTDNQVTEVFNRVAEDYRPFSVNITTDSLVFLAAPLQNRIRIIVTPTSSWSPNVGGIAWIGSFTWGDDTPAFVFCDKLGPNNPKIVGECCSHESGHAVGLSHQSRYGTDCNNPTEQYNSGIGTGEVSWAPIMGNSYYKNMSGWSNGPTPYGCTNLQDNLSTIATQNGFGYRSDDFDETVNTNTTPLNVSGFNVNGVISTTTDVDAFQINLSQSSQININANPFSVGMNNAGANLDIKLDIFNAAGTLIKSFDPSNSMSVMVDTILNSGTYFVKISGTGNANVSQYGSLGSYNLNGAIGVLPIHSVAITGRVEKLKHVINWKIIADEPMKNIIIETSTNGNNFYTLSSVNTTENEMLFSPLDVAVTYYRLKVTTVLNQTQISNTIALKSVSNNAKICTTSSIVKNDIVLNATENYQYVLMDNSGSLIAKGNGAKGINTINIANQPTGMYLITIQGKNEKQIERIIKQ
jgi:hypothetical protein